MREIVVIWYRGAAYQLGRGRDFYGIWPAGVPKGLPFERWPLTTEGWYAAWSRFAAIEVPGTIAPAQQGAAPAARQGAAPAAQQGAAPATQPDAVPAGQPAAPGGHPAALVGRDPADAVWGGSVSGGAVPGGPVPGGAVWGGAVPGGAVPGGSVPGGSVWGGPVPGGAVPGGAFLAAGPGPQSAQIARGDRRAVVAAALLAAGIVCGIAGLFPSYLFGSSLAQQPALLVTHAIYLAGWTASALLIWMAGARLRIGALLATGISIVTFGFFFADAGTVIAEGTHVGGAGLVLSLVGWLGCAAGSVLAFRLASAGRHRQAGWPARPRGRVIEAVLTLSLAAIGAAVAFAPAWDSYILRAGGRIVETVTAGNAFSNPGPVIAGNVAVMVALVAVVIAAALWRPALRGAALLAGAIIPMAAQAISGMVGVGEIPSPAYFGISSAQAAQAGLTISSGLTAAFWVYCGFVVALAALGAWMLVWRRPSPAAVPPSPAGIGVSPPAVSPPAVSPPPASPPAASTFS